MSEAKYTAGPWTVIGKHGYSVWVGNEIITSAMKGASISPATAHANAVLIAAAPALVEALQTLLDLYVGLVSSGDCGNRDVETEREVKDARSALALAGAQK